jgi:hypothetical protein
VIHIRARSSFHASFSILFLFLLAGPDFRTQAEEITGNIVFAGDSLTAGTGAGPRGSFPAQTLAILGRGWKGHNSGTSLNSPDPVSPGFRGRHSYLDELLYDRNRRNPRAPPLWLRAIYPK